MFHTVVLSRIVLEHNRSMDSSRAPLYYHHLARHKPAPTCAHSYQQSLYVAAVNRIMPRGHSEILGRPVSSLLTVFYVLHKSTQWHAPPSVEHHSTQYLCPLSSFKGFKIATRGHHWHYQTRHKLICIRSYQQSSYLTIHLCVNQILSKQDFPDDSQRSQLSRSPSIPDIATTYNQLQASTRPHIDCQPSSAVNMPVVTKPQGV